MPAAPIPSDPLRPTRSARRFRAPKVARLLRILVWNLVILVGTLVGVEGLASYSLLVRDVMTTYPLAERIHTQYDRELGWVNKPSVRIADVYGPGMGVQTNEDGFRSSHRFDPAVPSGRRRLICSGDSFTFGWGVDNEHTWCHLLASRAPGLETLNMGLGGYGIDQMYLSYKRDGLRFGHQVHLLAFITQDIRRMQFDTFATHYGKPVIDVENGALVVKNVPVPRTGYPLSWLTSQIENLQALRTWQLMWRVQKKLGAAGERATVAGGSPEEAQDAKTRLVLEKIFEELKHLNEEHGSVFVLVYLPILGEIPGDGQPPWITYVEQAAHKLGVPLVNLLHAFRRLPPDRAAQMFILRGQFRIPGSTGHLTLLGNEFIADVLHEEMQRHPEVVRALSIR
jgi:hypothetical protein